MNIPTTTAGSVQTLPKLTERKDQGLWEGSLYVFDKRMHLEFSEDAKTIGQCVRCAAPTSKFENCSNPSCRTLTLYCADCASSPETLRCPEGCAV